MNNDFSSFSLIQGPLVLAEHEVPALVSRLVSDLFAPGCIILLKGPLGAGKSSFVRLLARDLGVREAITSPTFSYVNIYELLAGGELAHFDLYRLSSQQSFFDAGFDEIVANSTYSAVEWPEVIAPFIQEIQQKTVFFVDFEYSNNHSERVITIYKR
jgi:tRNA threonylcarbamoyladenosine biosynthesis protein TsaE